MTENTGVCVVGSANIDLTFRTVRLPGAGETVAARGMQAGCGGKGANQAVMAALMGARVHLVARIGSDGFGRQLLDAIRDRGVDTTRVLVDPVRTTGIASIVVDDRGNNCIVVADGANGGLAVEDVRSAEPELVRAGVLLCQLEIPLAATIEAFRIARTAGVRTILNPAPAISLPAELLQLTDLCVPNETEAGVLTGIDAGTSDGAAAAARALRQRGARAVIITLGERGCLLDTEDGAEQFGAFPANVVDTTGAGDAFPGALAASLADGKTVRQAIPRASAAAALSVGRPGAMASFPSRRDVEDYLACGRDRFAANSADCEGKQP